MAEFPEERSKVRRRRRPSLLQDHPPLPLSPSSTPLPHTPATPLCPQVPYFSYPFSAPRPSTLEYSIPTPPDPSILEYPTHTPPNSLCPELLTPTPSTLETPRPHSGSPLPSNTPLPYPRTLCPMDSPLPQPGPLYPRDPVGPRGRSQHLGQESRPHPTKYCRRLRTNTSTEIPTLTSSNPSVSSPVSRRQTFGIVSRVTFYDRHPTTNVGPRGPADKVETCRAQDPRESQALGDPPEKGAHRHTHVHPVLCPHGGGWVSGYPSSRPTPRRGRVRTLRGLRTGRTTTFVGWHSFHPRGLFSFRTNSDSHIYGPASVSTTTCARIKWPG